MECALFNELSVFNTKDTSFHLHRKCFSWTLGIEAALHFKEIYKEHLTTFYLLDFLIHFFSFCRTKR